jgi:hypothetical protein
MHPIWMRGCKVTPSLDSDRSHDFADFAFGGAPAGPAGIAIDGFGVNGPARTGGPGIRVGRLSQHQGTPERRSPPPLTRHRSGPAQSRAGHLYFPIEARQRAAADGAGFVFVTGSPASTTI